MSAGRGSLSGVSMSPPFGSGTTPEGTPVAPALASVAAIFAQSQQEKEENGRRFSRLSDLIKEQGQESKVLHDSLRQYVDSELGRLSQAVTQQEAVVKDLVTKTDGLAEQLYSIDSIYRQLSNDVDELKNTVILRDDDAVQRATAFDVTITTLQVGQDQVTDDLAMLRRGIDELRSQKPILSPDECTSLRALLTREKEILDVLSKVDDAETCTTDAAFDPGIVLETQPAKTFPSDQKASPPWHPATLDSACVLETDDFTEFLGFLGQDEHELPSRSDNSTFKGMTEVLNGTQHSDPAAEIGRVAAASIRQLDQEEMEGKQMSLVTQEKRPRQDDAAEPEDRVDTKRARSQSPKASAREDLRLPPVLQAFRDHFFAKSEEYMARRNPRRDTQFIWSFISGIENDVLWSYTQKRLLEEYPHIVQARTRRGNGSRRIRQIEFKRLKWDQVRKCIIEDGCPSGFWE